MYGGSTVIPSGSIDKSKSNEDIAGRMRFLTKTFSSVGLINPKKSQPVQVSDNYVKWMCSRSTEHSLWQNEMYRTPLLKYIARIYQQETYIDKYFTEFNDKFPQFDELDLLNELIMKMKERHDARISLDKWKDNSRIERRLKDIKYIFDYKYKYSCLNSIFIVKPDHIQEIIDRKMIKSYFDFGCGDGIITASIGKYLGLTKDKIFGGDVYEGQCHDITFVKLIENQSTITLPNDSIDLVTAFVTFHHISNLEETLAELKRIVRSNGYLIIREHDSKTEFSYSTKYLNFVHGIMMIAGVGEFANHRANLSNQNQINNWSRTKSSIIDYTKTICYRTCKEWQQQLETVGFYLCATLHYGVDGSSNPQNLFYAIYQLKKTDN